MPEAGKNESQTSLDQGEKEKGIPLDHESRQMIKGKSPENKRSVVDGAEIHLCPTRTPIDRSMKLKRLRL